MNIFYPKEDNDILVKLLFEITKAISWNSNYRKRKEGIACADIEDTWTQKLVCNSHMEELLSHITDDLSVPDIALIPDEYEEALFDLSMNLDFHYQGKPNEY